MSHNLQTLKTVLNNVRKNRDAVLAQIEASKKAYGDPSPEVEAAINILIENYQENVQLIGHAIGAKMQIEQLVKTSKEIDTLIAALEVVEHDEHAESKITQHMNADLLRALSDKNAQNETVVAA